MVTITKILICNILSNIDTNFLRIRIFGAITNPKGSCMYMCAITYLIQAQHLIQKNKISYR